MNSAEKVADCVPVGSAVDETDGDHEGVLLELMDARVLADCALLLLTDGDAVPEPLDMVVIEVLAEGAALLLAGAVADAWLLSLALPEGGGVAAEDGEAASLPEQGAVTVAGLLRTAEALAALDASAVPLPPPRPAPSVALELKVSGAERQLEADGVAGSLARPVKEAAAVR